MSYYLCVDCGGSKTAAAIADKHGTILARGIGGPSNFAYLGLPAFLQALSATVSSALQSFLPPPPNGAPFLPVSAHEPLFAAAWLGVSGVDSAAAIARIVPPVTALLGVQPLVANDTHLLASPLSLHPDVSAAIGCVSGTGGIVVSFRRKPDDSGGLEELGRVGGWGWILGDEGGGFHVGRSAVRHILWEADCASVVAPELRDTASTLKDRVLQYFGVDDVFELLTVVHWPDPLPVSAPGSGPSVEAGGEKDAEGEKDAAPAPAYTQIAREKRLSSLAPLVFAAAFEDRDPLALRVLQHTTNELVDQLCVLLRPEADPPASAGDEPSTPKSYPARKIKASETILCFGGSLVGVAAYRQMILDELARRGHAVKRWTYVEDAAGTGARSLAAAAAAAAAEGKAGTEAKADVKEKEQEQES